MEDKVYEEVKITRKEIKSLVNSCMEFQSVGKLDNSYLYLIKK